MSGISGSSAANPDLDWSQLRETILMLNLAIAQIDQSMNEGSASVSTLSQSFTALATNLNDIQSAIAGMENNSNDQHKLKLIIQGSATTAADKVHASIVAFQFYDKLSQRLEHVCHSLNELNALIANPEALYSPTKWHALQQNIRSKYTMEEERKMFDNVISGMPVTKALELFRQEYQSKDHDAEDIELF